MNTSTITLPPTFSADLAAQSSAFFGNISGYVELVGGVILAAVVVEILLGFFHRR